MGKKVFLPIAVFILAAAVVYLSAIQEKKPVLPDKSPASGPLTIVTSFYPMYIATANIVKDVPGVKVINMTQPATGCLHDYQLRPDDLKILSEARIFVINGAGMESFMGKAIEQQSGLKVIDASRGISLIKNKKNDDFNPHVWVSINGAVKQVENISQQLAAIDPAHAAQYAANAKEYAGKLETLGTEMHRTLDGARKRNIITFHEALPYFASEFNLNVVGVVEREPGSEPSAEELAETIEIVKESGTSVLFADPQYPAGAAETIARETGLRLFFLDPAVSGPMELDAYIKIMESNLKTLEEALK